MSSNLLRSDIKLIRKRYDEALQMQGIPAKYQWPTHVEYNAQGEPVIEGYSDYIDTFIFFEGNPRITTFKRLGWVVENNSDLPFLLHCSYNLDHLQKECLFSMSGAYTDVPSRVFRVTEISYDFQAPDHVICQVVPEYEKQSVRKTESETRKKFNTSHTFIKPRTNYRGQYYTTQEDLGDDMKRFDRNSGD